jgi:ABC-type multidrug transport system fused ATPase/permease subunit
MTNQPVADVAAAAAAKEECRHEADGTEKSYGEKHTTDGLALDTWPENPQHGGFLYRTYLRWTYSYMSKVLDKGAQQKKLEGATHLQISDLFQIPSTMDSSYLSRKFWEYYDRNKQSKCRLVATLWCLAAPIFVPAGFCQLLTVACQVAMPLLVRELLVVLERSHNSQQQTIAQGMPYAIAIFLDLLLNGFGNDRHRHLALKTGVLMRASVVTILYEHVLRLTPKGRSGLTSGEIANLVAVDTQKLFEVAQEGHLIWSLPLSIVLVTVFLVLLMGWTTLVGIALLIFFVPLIGRVTTFYMSIRQKRVAMTDKRVELVNAMLQGVRFLLLFKVLLFLSMPVVRRRSWRLLPNSYYLAYYTVYQIKVTKLNNYEKNYEKRVMDARDKELKLLHKELAVWAMTLFITVLSPVVATAATFSCYVLVDENNILTASTSFSVILLFAALRFPINYAGRLIGSMC